MFDNINEGRAARASEIAQLFKKNQLNFLYGERYGGIGYCAFKYSKHELNIAATVRTSSNSYIRINPKLIKGNQSRCEEYEIEHTLILAFNWNKDRTIFQIDNKSILDNVSSVTKGGMLVFRESMLKFRVENMNATVTKLL